MSLVISFRPIQDADLGFLRGLYASTRADEMAVLPWTEQEKDDFIRFQFDAQHRYYHEQFSDAEFLVIEKDGEAIGRLYIDRREDEHRVIDIALLPAHRRSGIGGGILRDVLDEAAKAGKLVRIHVEANNPAMRLYLRLGFEKIEELGVYHLMEWVPK